MTAAAAAPTVYTIAPGVPFADAVAADLLRRCQGDASALAAVHLLLPTRRGCRTMTEAFLRGSGGAPLLLPRITPIGDVDEDDLGFDLAADDDPAADLTLPPPLPPLRRRILLTRLVRADPERDIPLEQAAALADELARLLDQAAIEGVDLSALDDLAPARYAEHWRKTLVLLRLITANWPKILADEGCMDAAGRRTALLEARAAAWRARPPAHPVIAAGSTGSIPATAALLDVVARLPRGAVILPGLDRDVDDDTWAAIDVTHPQYAMKRLLERIGLDRRLVADWPAPGATGATAARAALVQRAMRPSATAAAPGGAVDTGAALEHVARVDAPGPAEEARAIALIMRETVEGPAATAALVTPDRSLARRVAGELRRWDIEVDDSAGTPLLLTGPGVFLRLVAAAVAEDFAPVPLLALLKHPLAAAGAVPGDLRRRARRLDRAVLRGPRPTPGLAGLREAVAAGPEPHRDSCAALVDDVEHVLAPLIHAATTLPLDLSAVARAHAAAAEALAATDSASGAECLWRGEAGEAAAAYMTELAEAGDGLRLNTMADYVALFDALAAGRVVRPRWGRHPRLFIWGPLEARLQQADVTILGGLNEGTWPPQTHAGPWMSRQMMQECGLPLPERRIGLSAHDFVEAFSAPRVVLTRARRAEGAPTVACRWLLRLDAVMGEAAARACQDAGARWIRWQDELDRPAAVKATEQPAPCPPLEARPDTLSVTDTETWMRDPYAIYARHILKLRALDPLDAALGPREFGTFVHEAIKGFLHDGPPARDDALERLLAAGRAVFGNHLRLAEIQAFWWPRFESIAAWLVAEEERRAAFIRTLEIEVNGELTLALPDNPFTLQARADRIEVRRDGTLCVVDYKTGAPPSRKQVAAGFSPQLPLEAAMARQGGFKDVEGGQVAALEFWHLAGGREPGRIAPAGDDADTLATEALTGLAELVTEFRLPGSRYVARPRPAYAPKFSDYEHLERVREWAAAGGEDEP